MQHQPSPAAAIAAALAARAEEVCRRYLPNGRRLGRYWICGDLNGARGRSLFVRLSGSGKPGGWTDAATGQHGDLLDLIRYRTSAPTLRAALDEARAFLALEPAPDRVPGAPGRAIRRDRGGTPPVAALPRHRRQPCRALPACARARSLPLRGAALPSRASLPRRLDRAPFSGAGRRRHRRRPRIGSGAGGRILGLQRTWLDPRSPAKDYASYCTSLVPSGANSGGRCRCHRPRCLVGGCSGSSYRQRPSSL